VRDENFSHPHPRGDRDGMRVILKTTILRAYGTQRRFASATRIRENRLSSLIQGWADPSNKEKQTIARALGRSERGLFRNFDTEESESVPTRDAFA
jgi:transcriptional regulator with XRE-family HTH domain